MRGLVMKDFMNLERTGKQYALIFLGMAVVAVIMENPSFLSMYVILCSSMLLVSTFNYDEYTQFDLYVCGLPVSRKDVVKAKYMVLILLTALPTIAGIMLSILLNCFLRTDDVWELINFSVSIGCLFCIAFAVMVPFVYRMGAEKARMFMVGVWIVLFGGVYLLINHLGGSQIPSVLLAEGVQAVPLMAGMVLMAAVVVLCSYFVSKKIMLKKEF